MPAIDDVFRIIDFQTLLTEQCLNVYFYRVDAVAVPAPTLADIWLNFTATMMSPVQNIQASQVDHYLIRIENLMNPAEFLDTPMTGETGLVTGEVNPSFFAWSFLMRRTTKVTRNGGKRFPGVLESWVQNGVFVGVDASITAVEEALAAPIEGTFPPANYTLTPVIVKRNPDGTLDLTSLNVVRAGEFRGPSTQNTRKQLI